MPSVVPILLTGSALVIADIPLRLGTMIVGAMVMGFAVDEAIHVTSRYLLSRKTGAYVHTVITRSMTESARAVCALHLYGHVRCHSDGTRTHRRPHLFPCNFIFG